MVKANFSSDETNQSPSRATQADADRRAQRHFRAISTRNLSFETKYDETSTGSEIRDILQKSLK